ncbi:MAG TPA: AAA family ATPase [Spirochaetota bacterium]|nr:AAA family ATPase [Spirochaetota bacterium]HPV99357.1 AAA family ATPase [Spirochaetota bacterium]
MGRELSKITVKGYKSIRELEDFEIRDLNVLVGANGAGKSNFIQLFDLLHNILEMNLQNYVAKNGGADALLHHGGKRTGALNLKFEFGRNIYECTLEPDAQQSLFFSNETICYHDQRYQYPYCTDIGSGHRESRLKSESQSRPYARIADYVIEAIRSWKLYHFHDTGFTAKVKGLGNIDDNAYLRPDASNLAAYLFYLKNVETSYYRNIVDMIKKVAPFFGGFNLRPAPANNNTIRLEWNEEGSDAYYNAHSFSDGTLRFICLATLLLQPEKNLPSVILLDEPELGLHPYAICVLADMLRFASKKTQIIVSTQSVTLVNQFGPEDLIIVDRESESSVFRRPAPNEIESWLDDYALGDIWEKNLMGGRP